MKLILFFLPFTLFAQTADIDTGDGTDGICDEIKLNFDKNKRTYNCTSVDINGVVDYSGLSNDLGTDPLIILSQGDVDINANINISSPSTVIDGGANFVGGVINIVGGSAGPGGRSGGDCDQTVANVCAQVGADDDGHSDVNGGGINGTAEALFNNGGGGGGGARYAADNDDLDPANDATDGSAGSNGALGGVAGTAYGAESDFENNFYGGSGGGAGGTGVNGGFTTVFGGAGGGGGGAIKIVASGNINITASISAQGGNGSFGTNAGPNPGPGSGAGPGGGGGGGSGGAIWLVSGANIVINNINFLDVSGGNQGPLANGAGGFGAGGVGGRGRIRLDDIDGAVANAQLFADVNQVPLVAATPTPTPTPATQTEFNGDISCASVTLIGDDDDHSQGPMVPAVVFLLGLGLALMFRSRKPS